MIHIGFTGTTTGMSEAQRATLEHLLTTQARRDLVMLHHGDCVGADMEAHELAHALRLALITVHPPIKEDRRAFCQGNYMRAPASYFARDRDIVDETAYLLAAPRSFSDRSGSTWWAVSYAAKQRKTTCIIWPDGTTETRNGKS